jgi:hypothetical protein
VVDLQHDFLPGGALAVPDGDAVVEPIRSDSPISGQPFRPYARTSR